VKIHVLVEGASEREFLDRWAPRAFPGHAFKVHPHQGKGRLPQDFAEGPNPKARGLLDMLPAKLRAFGRSFAADEAVVVLVDADDENCSELRKRLGELQASISPCPRVAFRIAVEETEAFYLGDLRALRAAFPDADMQRARSYRNDEVCGTAELLDEIVGDGGMNKVAWAKKMGDHLTTDPAKSQSPSFKAFHAALLRLVRPTSANGKKKKPYRHVARTAKNRARRTRSERG
jgi:Domain of unknown function (DUF4276)